MPHFSRRFLSLLSFAIVLAIIFLTREPGQPDEKTGEYLGVPEYVQLPELFTADQLRVRHWTNHHGALVYFLRLPMVSRLDVHFTYDAGFVKHENPLIPYLVNKLLLVNPQLSSYIKRMNLKVSSSVDIVESGIHLQTVKADEYLWPSIKLLKQYVNEYSLQNDYSSENIRKIVDQYSADVTWGGSVSDEYPSLPTLLSFYRRYYSVNNLTISVIGDISIERAKLITDRLIAGMPVTALDKLSTANSHLTEKFYRKIDLKTYTLIIPFQYNDVYHAADLDLPADIINTSLKEKLVAMGGQWVKSDRVYYRDQVQLVCHFSMANSAADKHLMEVINKSITPIIYVGPTHKQIHKAKQLNISLWNLQHQDQQWLGDKLAKIAFNQWSADYFTRYEERLALADKRRLQAIMKTSMALDKIQLIHNHTAMNQKIIDRDSINKHEEQ